LKPANRIFAPLSSATMERRELDGTILTPEAPKSVGRERFSAFMHSGETADFSTTPTLKQSTVLYRRSRGSNLEQ
jgi:hypothetical protein